MHTTIRAGLWLLVLVATCFACSHSSGSTPTGAPAITQTVQTAVVSMRTQTPAPAASPTPEVATPTDSSGLLPESEEGVEPFNNCDITPGLVGCDAQAPAIAARLAVQDPQSKRVLVLDLTSGEGWQLDGEVSSIDWLANRIWLQLNSPDRSWLFDFLLKDRSEQAVSPPVYDDDSRAAWIEQSGGYVALRVLAMGADGADVVFLHPHSPETIYQPDRLYLLRAWVPGQNRVLAQIYTAGGDAMINGGELALIDAATGELTGLDVRAPITAGAEFAWNPQQPDQLAFLARGEAGAPPRLAFLDLTTRRWTTPKEEGLCVDGLAWQPDGQRLTFAAQWDQPGDANRYPAPGIYALDPESGMVAQLTQPPRNAEDGRPGWSADGDVLIYGRWITSAPGSGLIQVRARRIVDGQEWLLVEMPGGEPERLMGRIFWQRYMAVVSGS